MKKIVLSALVLSLALVLFTPTPALASSDIVRVSGDIVVAADEKVTGNVVAVNGNIDIYGEVSGDVVSVLGRITVYEEGYILGNAVAVVGGLDIEPGGRVVGNQVQVSSLGLQFPRGISWSLFRPRINVGTQIFLFIVNLIFALLVFAIAPRHVKNVQEKIRLQPAVNALWGLLLALMATVLLVVLLITIIGPFAIIILGGIAWLLGFTALAMLVGESLLSRYEFEPFAALALGVFILKVLTAIPVLGWMAWIGITLVALGAGVTSKFGVNGGGIQ